MLPQFTTMLTYPALFLGLGLSLWAWALIFREILARCGYTKYKPALKGDVLIFCFASSAFFWWMVISLTPRP